MCVCVCASRSEDEEKRGRWRIFCVTSDARVCCDPLRANPERIKYFPKRPYLDIWRYLEGRRRLANEIFFECKPNILRWCGTLSMLAMRERTTFIPLSHPADRNVCMLLCSRYSPRGSWRGDRRRRPNGGGQRGRHRGWKPVEPWGRRRHGCRRGRRSSLRPSFMCGSEAEASSVFL